MNRSVFVLVVLLVEGAALGREKGESVGTFAVIAREPGQTAGSLVPRVSIVIRGHHLEVTPHGSSFLPRQTFVVTKDSTANGTRRIEFERPNVGRRLAKGNLARWNRLIPKASFTAITGDGSLEIAPDGRFTMIDRADRTFLPQRVERVEIELVGERRSR
jgi:hypothetical protein